MVKFCICSYIRLFGITSFDECTHITSIATTKDTVKDIAATHCDIGVAQHVGSITTTKDTANDIGTFICFRGDVHIGITSDIGSITTTKYISYNTQIFGVRCSLRNIKTQRSHDGRNSRSRMFTRYHIDIHRRAGIHRGRCAQATTEYFADIGAGDDVQFGLSVGEGMSSIFCRIGDRSLIAFCCWIGYSMHFSGSWLQNLLTRFCLDIFTLIIAIDRVGSLVTTQIELINLDRLTARFLHVHRDFTLHGTTQVITAKHLAEVAVSDVQRDVTIHVRLVSTRKQQGHLG